MEMGQGANLRILVLFVLVTNLMQAAYADAVSPYRSTVALQGFYDLRGRSGSRAEREVIPTVRLAGRIYGEGAIDARFSIRKNKTWEAFTQTGGTRRKDALDPVLLQGSLALGGGWRRSGRRIFPSAASIINNELKVTFPGRVRGSRRTRQRVYTIRLSLDGSLIVTARVSSIPSSAVKRGACGVEVGNYSNERPIVEPLSRAAYQQSTPKTVKVVTLSTDADPEWFAKYGQRSNAVIASIVNAAEAIYDRQLNIRFRLVKQHVYTDTSPYTMSDPGGMLTAFVRNAQNPLNLGVNPNTFNQDVDLKHLFTGKDFDGGVIGIAYIGVVCAIPSLSYGITQAFGDGPTAGIFAHEVGHNFGAYHDSNGRGSIMYPSISIPPSQYFSAMSLNEMNKHVNGSAPCFSVESVVPGNETPVPPTPEPPDETPAPKAIITLGKQRVGDRRNPVVRLAGRMLTPASLPLAQVQLQLISESVVIASTTTDDEGRFQFFVRVVIPREDSIEVNVQTIDGEVSSSTLTLLRTSPKQR